MTNRVAGAAKLGVALGHLAALLALTALGACSGRSTGGGGTRGRPDWPVAEGDWPAAAPLPPPVIPAFPDLCSELQIRVASPPDGSQYVACPCTGQLYLCGLSNCASSVDCDAVCSAWEDQSRPQVTDCGGYCTSDDFCGGGRCFTLPGASRGTCSSKWCLEDDDCGTGIPCVAVRPDGVRRCATQSECNTTADCAEGHRCALPDQSFVGTCGDGRDYSYCYRASDCRIGWHCAHEADLTDPPDRGRCTSGLETAPCGSNDDCADGGKCFAKLCTTGEPGAACMDAGDCLSAACTRAPEPRVGDPGVCD